MASKREQQVSAVLPVELDRQLHLQRQKQEWPLISHFFMCMIPSIAYIYNMHGQVVKVKIPSNLYKSMLLDIYHVHCHHELNFVHARCLLTSTCQVAIVCILGFQGMLHVSRLRSSIIYFHGQSPMNLNSCYHACMYSTYKPPSPNKTRLTQIQISSETQLFKP